MICGQATDNSYIPWEPSKRARQFLNTSMVTSTTFYRSPWTPTQTRTSMEHSTTCWIAMNVTSSTGVVRIEAVLGNTSDGNLQNVLEQDHLIDLGVLKSKEMLKEKLRRYFRGELGVRRKSITFLNYKNMAFHLFTPGTGWLLTQCLKDYRNFNLLILLCH